MRTKTITVSSQSDRPRTTWSLGGVLPQGMPRQMPMNGTALQANRNTWRDSELSDYVKYKVASSARQVIMVVDLVASRTVLEVNHKGDKAERQV